LWGGSHLSYSLDFFGKRVFKPNGGYGEGWRSTDWGCQNLSLAF